MIIHVKNEPNWLYETFALLSLGFDNDPAYPMKFIQDPSTYQMTREEIGKKLGQTTTYLKTVYSKTRKLLAAYKDVEKYFTGERYGSTAILASSLDCVKMLSSTDYRAMLYRHVLFQTMELGTDESELVLDREPNVGDIFAAVSKTNWTDADKFKIMELFQSSDADFPRMHELMLKTEDVLTSHYGLIREKYESAVADYSYNNSKKTQELLTQAVDMFGSLTFEKINAFFSIIDLNQLNLVVPFYDQTICHVAIGLDFVRLGELKDLNARRDELLLHKLKALADTNKLKIIRLISQRPMYLKELSDTLGITAATVSHHMGQLLEEKLVRFEIDGRKVYYSVNATEFTDLSESIAEIAERSLLNHEKHS